MYWQLYIVQLNQRKGRLASQERNHVAKMLAINTCVFFICLAPIQISNLVYRFSNITLPGTVVWILFIIGSFNSAVNPLIYNTFNAQYREALYRAFTFSRRRHQTPPENPAERRRSLRDGEEIEMRHIAK